jgi:hypothetical protein
MVKLLQETVGNTLDHIGIDNNFMNRPPRAQQLRVIIGKWDWTKLKVSA